MSVDYMLRQARKRGCAIVSIITALESTRIEVEFLHTKSDFVFTGSANPENDLPGIKDLLHEEGLIPF
ncbi:MAG TPA: hypothetical protein VIT23_03115, partial [Terrimicrobiaceae bacterium]